MAKKKRPVKSVPAPSAAPNMFETLWSRRKFDVLGKKQKGEGRRIGQLRSRGIEKRKKTLLKEYKIRHKSNEFIDRRFGENDENMSEDEKAIMRFQRERQSQLQKKNKFVLPDVEDEEEDVLTHKGAALSALDDFKDDVSGDEDDEPNGLDAEAVRHLNFGGGEENQNTKEHKSKKEVMEEIIAKSKHFKALKAKQKEDDLDLREKLDNEFKLIARTPALLSLMRPKKMSALKAIAVKESNEVPEKEKDEPDDYDKLMKEMVFESRAHASDRIKTPEELAKEEMERLQELEKKRIQRMRGTEDSESENEDSDLESEGKSKRKRKRRAEVSGDDLGENFVLEEEPQEKGWVDEVMARTDEQVPGSSDDEEDDDEEEEEEDDDDGADGDDDEGDGNAVAVSDEEGLDKSVLPQEQRKQDEIKDTPMELPFVIKAPQTLDEFRQLVKNRSDAELELAIQRVRTCSAISLAAENRKRMQIFYNVLLLYFSEVSASKSFSLSTIDVLTRHLIEMSSETPYFAAVCARERIIRVQKQLSDKLRNSDRSSSSWPSVRTVLLVRLWSLIFPGSDFRHVVMTPLVLLMGEHLLRCPVNSGRDVAVGAFLCSLLLSSMRHARRLCPEALSFLLALLSTGLEDKSAAWKNCPDFLKELVGSHPWLRIQDSSSSALALQPLDFVEVMTAEPDSHMFNTDTFRVSILNVSLQTLKGFVGIYSDLPSCPEIFRHFLPVLLELSRNLPVCLKASFTEIINLMTETVIRVEKFRQPLRMRLKKPTPIKQFNPKFEEDFVKGRDYDIDRDRAERKKLQRQIKRESKGAARELRKDNQFLAAEKGRERAEIEQEREAKYNKAMAFLQEQESAAKSGQLGRKRRRR